MPFVVEQPKCCRECGQTKGPGAFHLRSGGISGRMDTCRDCMTARRKAEAKKSSSILRVQSSCSRGELHDETYEARRDQYCVLVGAAADRWRKADDQEDRDGAREALLFRCRQLLEAEGLVSG